MKKIITLFALVLCLRTANAQHYADNAIIIKNVSFDSAVRKMKDMGYHIQDVNSDKKICMTIPSVSGLALILKVDKKDRLYVSGKYTAKYISSGTHSTADVLYMKRGEQHDLWLEMMKYASQFNDIAYTSL